METMQHLNKDKGITILHITHYMQEAILADRVIVMDKGQVMLDGTPKEVFKNVKQIKSIGLDVPEATYLTFLLNEKGYNLDPTILSTQEVVDALCQLSLKI
jgi:energy-coupling factor transport system ATP-binding protein